MNDVKQLIEVGKDNAGIYYKLYKKVDDNHVSKSFKNFTIATNFNEKEIQKFIESIESDKPDLRKLLGIK